MAPVTPTLECRLINACVASYAIKDGKLSPSAPGYAQIGIKPGTVPTVFTDGIEHINAGYVAQTYDDWVFLVFRGTLPPFKGDFWAWITDWLNDFRIGPTTWTVGGKPFGQVETGFASAVLDLWPMVLAALKPIDLQTKKGIIVTGHSKGAAMTFLASSLLKGQYYKNLLIENCCYAAPLTCDTTFRNNYNALGIRPFTVRYQNEYDIVPFLPYVPALDALATAERLSRPEHANLTINDAIRARQLKNDYVPVGIVRYITTGCAIEYGERAEKDAWDALLDALLHFRFSEIVEAHAAVGRYSTCVCK